MCENSLKVPLWQGGLPDRPGKGKGIAPPVVIPIGGIVLSVGLVLRNTNNFGRVGRSEALPTLPDQSSEIEMLHHTGLCPPLENKTRL